MVETLKFKQKDILICNIPRYYSYTDVYSLGRKIGIDKETYSGEGITLVRLAEEFITNVYRLGKEEQLINIIKNSENLFRRNLVEELNSIESKPNLKNINNEKKIILNISDIHINNDDDLNRYKLQLKTDLIKNQKINKLDYILISGDITQIANKYEFELAYNFINNIVERFNVETKKIIIVPGNHDLEWDICKNSVDSNGQIINKELYIEKFKNFNEYFYRPLCKNEYPLKEDMQGILKILDDDKLIFLELNSAWEIDHINKRKSGININSLYNALDILLENEQYEDYRKIAVFHHPVSGQEQMNNEFLELLIQHEFIACIHGHIHQAEYNFSRYDINLGINIIGTGTFGAPVDEQVSGIPLQYNLIEVEQKEIVVKTRKKEKVNGAWMADARWGSKECPVPEYIINIQLKNT